MKTEYLKSQLWTLVVKLYLKKITDDTLDGY